MILLAMAQALALAHDLFLKFGGITRLLRKRRSPTRQASAFNVSLTPKGLVRALNL